MKNEHKAPIELAIHSFEKGDTTQAFVLLQEVLKEDSLCEEAIETAAIFKWKQNNWQSSLEILGNGLKQKPESRLFLFRYAQIYFKLGQIEKAKASTQELARITGENTDTLLASLSKEIDFEQLQNNTPSKKIPINGFTRAVELLCFLVETFHFKKYLEIGCWEDQTFSQIPLAYKVGVDPVQGGTLRMTSDAFFEASTDSFDLIFLDGLHQAEQVVKDVDNALKQLRPAGFVVLHDCNPATERMQQKEPVDGPWNGDVWKALVHFRQRDDLEIKVGDFDHGLGIIRRAKNPSPLTLKEEALSLRWQDLQENRSEWLQLRSPEQLQDWLQALAKK